MSIGIIAAIHDELAELIAIITQQSTSQTHHIGMRDYYVGELEGQACVLVLARIGKVAAAATAVTLIREFGVSEILFTGVAGGLAPHANVGDVVVADRLLQHDMDASPLFPKHEIPLLGIREFIAPKSLCEELQTAVQQFLEHDIAHKIPAETMAQFGLVKPSMHVGMIVCGDQFIGVANQAADIRAALPMALAAEMEGAAVAQICHEYGVPCAVMRTISDRADATAHVDFSAFVTAVASHYSSGILQRFLINRNT